MNKDLFTINGKNTLITGVTGDFGQSIAKHFIQLGQNITGIGRDISKLGDLENYINFHSIDLSNEDEIIQFCKNSQHSFDNIILSHGINGARPIRMVNKQFTDNILNNNFTSSIVILSNLIRSRKISSPGRVIAISSISAHMGAANSIIYSASKSALESAFKSMARDYMKKDITFNSIAPAAILTSLFEGNTNLQVLKEETYPLGIGKTEDIAYACEFLCAKGARHITGETVLLAGGATYLE